MSMLGSTVAQFGICALGESPEEHPDVVRQANERLSTIRRLRKQLSADLRPCQKDRIDNAIQDTKESIAAAAKWSEPALEKVGGRPRWGPDSSVLQRLKWSTKDLAEMTAYSDQVLAAPQPLNDAMEILSSCEGRKSSTLESSSELSEFLNRRRRIAARHTVYSDGEPPGCLDNGTQRDIQSESRPTAEPQLKVGFSGHPRTIETTSEQFSRRNVMGTINHGYASQTDYLQRIGRALDCDAALGTAMTDLHKGLDYQLPFAVEAAEIWRHNTETALVTTQHCIGHEQSIEDEEARKPVDNTGEDPDASSTSTGVLGEDQTAVSIDDALITQRQEIDALRSKLMSMREDLTKTSPSSPVAHSSPAGNYLPYRVPRRKPLPTMASFSSSQSTNGAPSSANDWNSSGTEDTDFAHHPRTQPSFQDADKHVIFPAEETTRPLTHPDVSAVKGPSEGYLALTGNGSAVTIATVSAPTYNMTRGRAWLEQRAQTQG